MHKLGGGYSFTKIDLADACNQISLSKESQKKLDLSTHKGVLLQMRLPLGISSAPGYFQEIMFQLTNDLTLSLPRSSIDDLVFSVFSSNFGKLSYKISLLKNRFVTLFFIRFS